MIHISFPNLLFSREYLHCICFLATDLAYALVSNQWAVRLSQMYFLKIVLPSKSKRFIRVIYICRKVFSLFVAAFRQRNCKKITCNFTCSYIFTGLWGCPFWMTYSSVIMSKCWLHQGCLILRTSLLNILGEIHPIKYVITF